MELFSASPLALVLGILLSVIGTAYMWHARRQKLFVPMFCGIGMILVATLSVQPLVLIAGAVVFIAVPFFVPG